MRDVYEGDTNGLLQGFKFDLQSFAEFGIKRPKWFIQQKYLWAEDEGSSQSHPLLLATG